MRMTIDTSRCMTSSPQYRHVRNKCHWITFLMWNFFVSIEENNYATFLFKSIGIQCLIAEILSYILNFLKWQIYYCMLIPNISYEGSHFPTLDIGIYILNYINNPPPPWHSKYEIVWFAFTLLSIVPVTFCGLPTIAMEKPYGNVFLK